MSEHRHLLSRFKRKVGPASQPPGFMECAQYSAETLFDNMPLNEASGADIGLALNRDDRAETKLRRIINYINGYHASEKRVIDMMIQESAARWLESYTERCPRCRKGWMQPVGFVMCGPMKLRELAVPEMFSAQTLRCDRGECRFEQQPPQALVGGRA